MLFSKEFPFLFIRLIRFTIFRMITVGMLLRQSVDEAPPLPAGYEKEEIFHEFFMSIQALENGVAIRTPVEEIPELADALMGVKDSIREVGGVIEARLNSRNETVWNAAVTLKNDFFPNGLDVVTEKQHDVVGWTKLALKRLDEEYPDEVRDARVSVETTAMAEALWHYNAVAGRFMVLPQPGELPKTQAVLLGVSRDALDGVILELGHAVKRHPECLGVVKGILRPLSELMEKVRADEAKAKKAAAADGDAGETPSNDDGETEEAEVEDTETVEDDEVEDTEDSEDEAELEEADPESLAAGTTLEDEDEISANDAEMEIEFEDEDDAGEEEVA